MKTLFTKQTVLSGLPLALLCCLLTFSTTVALAGAACDNTGADGQWPGSTITVDAAGAVTTISGIQYAGSEFSVVDGLVAGRSYEFTHANGAFITVREGAAGGTVIGTGFSPLTIVATSGADVYVHWTVDAGCATDGTGSFLTTVQDVTPPCDMSGESGQWPGSTITVGAEGVETTISGIQYAGSEYAVVDGFISGNYYELGHEAGSYITVREGAVAGPVVAAGFSPLQFTATSTATLYVHYTVDAACTVDASGSWDTYVTNLGLQPCDNTSASGQWPASSITPDAGGAVTTISTIMYAASEFSVITGVLASHEYAFEHAGAGYATVRIGAADGPVLGSGTLPLVVQATGTDDLYVHWTLDASCATDATGSFLATVQDLGVPPCDNTSASGQWPGSSITPDALGAVTLINGIMYAGSEYSVITSIVAGYDYEFIHESGAYVTVREGAVDGPVIAAGFSPLTATAASASDLYVHWTVDEFCNTDATGSWDATVQITSCLAEVGSTIADATPLCLDGGSAALGAESDGTEVVPTGYTTVYVLTDADNNLEILDANATGDFTVNAGGNYIIHTFVYDPAEVPDLTPFVGQSATVVVGLIADETICAALDVTGAPITVNAPEVGATIADATPVCLDGGSAALGAESDGNEVVPAGYAVAYVLTDADNGLEILDANATGDFTVTAGGNYIIHTFVYDPAVITDFTPYVGQSATVVVGLIADGTICAALDVTGAPITVNEQPTATISGGGVACDGGNAPFEVAMTGNGPWDFTVVIDGVNPNPFTGVTTNPSVFGSAFAGTYTVIDVSDASCPGVGLGSAVITEEITAESDWSSAQVTGTLSVDFTDASLNTPSSWLWDLGDGNTSTMQNPTHTYAQAGTYTVCLTVTNDCGSDSSCAAVVVAPVPPANDLCTGAVAVTCGSTTSGDTENATADDAPNGNNTVSEGVWYVLAGTDQVVTASTCGATWDTEIVVMEGSCGSLTYVGNNDDDCGLQSTYSWFANAGTDYYIYVGDFSDNVGVGGNTGTFDLAITCVAPLANDECQGAVMLAVGTSCISTSGTVDGATESLPGCLGTANDDVWYSFVADATTATVEVTGAADFDAVLEVFDGACVGTSLGCADLTLDAGTESLDLTGLVPGNTYYFRVYHYYTALTTTPTFDVCVYNIVTGVNEMLDEGLSVYPNPSNGEFVVEVSGVEADAQLTVLDVTGRVVYTEGAVLNGNFRKSLNLDVASGTYLLQVATEEGLVTRKIQIH